MMASLTDVKPIAELLDEVTRAPQIGSATPQTRGSVLAPDEVLELKPDPVETMLARIEGKIDALDSRSVQEAHLSALAENGQLVFNSTALVAAFHEAFGVPIEDGPTIPDDARVALRIGLIEEEFGELKRVLTRALEMRASGEPVPPEAFIRVAKEICDLQYVLDGTFLELGLGSIKSHLLNAVHTSNMTKLGADGAPIYRADGKVMKGPHYQPADADIAEILESAVP